MASSNLQDKSDESGYSQEVLDFAAGLSKSAESEGVGFTPNLGALSDFLAMMKADAEELKRTGEDPRVKMMREKMEWARQDTRSAGLKPIGNEAFSKGDFKEALIIYSVCIRESAQEDLYWLNLTAAALKLKLYDFAVRSASKCIPGPNTGPAKAHFRRGQAYRYLGNFDKALQDLQVAHQLEPRDPLIQAEITEVKRLTALEDESKQAWIAGQGARGINDIFEGGTEEYERLVEAKLEWAKVEFGE
ncbi:TPR-like protein [Dendrothele bispora CBS 962.96]|uniref:TPR-like protein n=1 Tax=Dendrothele bispora (strain CBS 962.96) TaxID=1314807 RepID=A0A4S8L8H8_DENBC|nr:TPR-like protein [Dendrothele bispora CBS 962.96]